VRIGGQSAAVAARARSIIPFSRGRGAGSPLWTRPASGSGRSRTGARAASTPTPPAAVGRRRATRCAPPSRSPGPPPPPGPPRRPVAAARFRLRVAPILHLPLDLPHAAHLLLEPLLRVPVGFVDRPRRLAREVELAQLVGGAGEHRRDGLADRVLTVGDDPDD